MSTVAGYLQPLALAAVTVGLAALVYRDGRRVGLERPLLWAAVVFATVGAGGVLYAVVGAPAAGSLVVALAGGVFYLFEREDATHGDEPADPHTLPGADPGDERDER